MYGTIPFGDSLSSDVHQCCNLSNLPYLSERAHTPPEAGSADTGPYHLPAELLKGEGSTPLSGQSFRF